MVASPAAWAAELGYTIDPVEIPCADWGHWGLEGVEGRLWRLGHLSGHEGFALLWLESSEPFESGSASSWLESWAGRLWRRDRTFRGLLLASEGEELVVTVPFPTGQAGRPGVHQVWVRSQEVRPVELERLERLRPKAGESPESITARLREELDIAEVGRRFFEALRRTHGLLSGGFVGWRGVVTSSERDEAALVTLNRLIFLYFLERKGLLGGRRDFVRSEVRRARAEGRGVYTHVLRPLFFAVLNTPAESRSARASAFGAVPYLNGGLFEPTALERLHPDLRVDDEVLQEVFDGLFERFSFTTREDGPGAGIDPEVLGRAFESLMESEQRAETGTFYTPRGLVREVLSEALAEVLVAQGLERGVAEELLSGRVAGELGRERLEGLLEKVEHLTVLDPACGSGAFLLGAMHQLERLVVTLRGALGLRCPSSGALRRQIIQHNLYGVDVNPGAVHLCELRLWLAIVDAEPAEAPILPLPNLDHRVRCGDSLMSVLDWMGRQVVWQEHRASIAELEGFKASYACATGSEKRALRDILRAAEAELLGELLDGQREALQRARAPLAAMLEGRDLFGRLVKPPGVVKKELADLERRLDGIERLRERLEREGSPPGFSPELHFPEAMSNGGFDVVVGNPPWVRPHAVPVMQRRWLRRRYDVMEKPGWTASGMLRTGAGQVDLSACFVERALELTRPGGVVAMLVPSKLTRALGAAAFRRMLARQATLSLVWEVDPGHFADAATYPCVIVARALDTVAGPERVRLRRGEEAVREVVGERLRLVAGDLGSPWVTAPVSRPRPEGPGAVRAGHLEGLKIARGVMTGCNHVFVREGEVATEVAWAYLVRGADISAFGWTRRDRMIWPHCPQTGGPLPTLSPALVAELGPHRRELERRPELTERDPWWRIFRTGPQLLGPKVAWRDLGTHLQAVALPGMWEGRPVVPLNTVYYIPVADEAMALALAAWLNSTVARDFARGVAERARGDHRRFFGWVIAMLPMPDALGRALGPGGERSPEVEALVELSRELHGSPERASEAQGMLDALVRELYDEGEEQPSLLGRAS